MRALYCKMTKNETGITVKTISQARVEMVSEYLDLLPGEYGRMSPRAYRTKIVEVLCDACDYFTRDLSELKGLEDKECHWSELEEEETPVSYDYLKSLVIHPFTLSDKEKQDIKYFIRIHGFKKSSFDWFLEVTGQGLPLISTEIQDLLHFVDLLRRTGTTTDNMVRHCEECKKYEWRCECEDREKRKPCDCKDKCELGTIPRFICLYYIAGQDEANDRNA